MSIAEFAEAFITGLQQTGPLEYIGVFTGILSVVFSRIENIWVYPTGIISTAIYTYISLEGGLYAESALNIYYTVMSLIGWYMWARKKDGHDVLHITRSSSKDWLVSLSFFAAMLVILFLLLRRFTNSTVPLGDAFTSAAAYTGMLLMNKKKIEHWFWWIITNILSTWLYFIKGYVFTSVQFVVLLLLAISGWMVWHKKMQQAAA
jgi:nicotinamide mononucleotide transporter